MIAESSIYCANIWMKGADGEQLNNYVESWGGSILWQSCCTFGGLPTVLEQILWGEG